MSSVHFHTVLPHDRENFHSGIAYARATNTTRKLAELPANVATPTFFCEQAKKLFSGSPKVQVIEHDVEWAKSKKMGSFLSVTHGSDEPAKFLEIHYRGGDPKNQPWAFVGKGVTFGRNVLHIS